jgi:hypothetical protein
MHCELIVPGLFAEASGARPPALELLLARGRSSNAESMSLETWLQEHFDIEEAPLAAGALTLAGAGRDPGADHWVRADPVHLQLMRDRLILVPSAAFTLSLEEAEALVAALNHHFTDRLYLQAVEAGRWCARIQKEVAAELSPPLYAAGRAVDLRGGALVNEVQMLLHAHPVNEAREARGEPVVNSLWLWGAGKAPAVPPARWQTVWANDPIALGLARLGGARARRLPENADALLGQSPPESRQLVVLDSLRAPLALGQAGDYRSSIDALEENWFAPLLAALRRGSIGMVTLHVPDSLAASFETIRGDLRRFWRRPRALEKYA